jgi:hypothetical protein
MGLRKHRSGRELSSWDKAFWGSFGTFLATVLVLGVSMYIGDIPSPFDNAAGALGTIMKIDKILGSASLVSTIITAVFKTWFQ